MILTDIHKLKTEDYISLALEVGFSYAAPLAMDSLEFRPEVRDMCSADRCRSYGKSWSCPPGCGELDVLRAQLRPYTRGILVQTVGQLEDSFDAEGMMAAKEAHQANQLLLEALLRPRYPRLRAMGAGKLCIFRLLVLPGNLPAVINALKVNNLIHGQMHTRCNEVS